MSRVQICTSFLLLALSPVLVSLAAGSSIHSEERVLQRAIDSDYFNNTDAGAILALANTGRCVSYTTNSSSYLFDAHNERSQAACAIHCPMDRGDLAVDWNVSLPV